MSRARAITMGVGATAVAVTIGLGARAYFGRSQTLPSNVSEQRQVRAAENSALTGGGECKYAGGQLREVDCKGGGDCFFRSLAAGVAYAEGTAHDEQGLNDAADAGHEDLRTKLWPESEPGQWAPNDKLEGFATLHQNISLITMFGDGHFARGAGANRVRAEVYRDGEVRGYENFGATTSIPRNSINIVHVNGNHFRLLVPWGCSQAQPRNGATVNPS